MVLFSSGSKDINTSFTPINSGIVYASTLIKLGATGEWVWNE